MALIACKECGNQVSSSASTCPKCGAPTPKPSNAKAQALTAAISVGVLALVLGASRISGSATSTAPIAPERNSVAELRQKAAVTILATCRTNLPAMKAEYARLLDEKKYWDASRAFGECPDVLKDDESLKKLSDGAARLSFIATIEDSKAGVDDRLWAIQKLRNVGSTEDAERVEPLRRKLQAESDKATALLVKKAEAADLARRKKEGVELGMSQDDVLKSAWGRPRRINRSTYTFGVHEQWVYDGGYLYFENGTLKTIQN